MAVSKRKFKTEVQQLLDLVIHSLYTKKEIFLRELISNASDAIDRARFESLKDESILENDPVWQIKLIPDAAAKTLTIRDNGIGMNREEVEQNIGTIASSGTRRFIEEMRKSDKPTNLELIGQFGVGFYSAFMVADRVTVVTRRAGAPADSAVRWESAGDGTYTMADAVKEGRGTEITLHLREDAAEYTEEWRLKRTVKRYSDFVTYPVVMDVTRSQPVLDDEGKPDPKAKPVETTAEETLNSMKAIWKRSKSEIKEEEYEEFYRHVSHNFGKPAEVIHYKAEGVTEFTALLYIPEKAPWDVFTREERKGLHLYVKNVFITDDCREILPEYLRFVAGIVDSSDLPLNVSRETLQDEAIVQRIRKGLVSKILGAFADLKEQKPEKYEAFWKELGRVLKEGMHFDFANQDKLKDLLLYESSHTEPGKYTSLKQYVERMPESQKAVYYLTGESRDAVANSPYLEALAAHGYEVLYMTDAIDEWVTQSLNEYDSKPLTAINKGDLDLDAPEEKEQKEKEREEIRGELKDLLAHMQDKLKEQVQEVRLSTRLTDSACCLVAGEQGMDARMERIYKAMNQEFMPGKRILEVNPKHPVLEVMKGLYEQEPGSERLNDYIGLLYDQALLNEGSPVRNPVRFTRLISSLMVDAKK